MPEYRSILEKLSDYSRRNTIPFYTLLEITKKCDIRCRHCYIAEASGRKEMTAGRIKSLFDELKDMGVLFLTLTGGEPTVRPDFLEILRSAHERGFVIQLFTNGQSMNPELANIISGFNILYVGVSIYGATPAVHDSVTRMKGSWNKSISAVKMLKEAGLTPVLKFVMMKDNMKEFGKMKMLADELGIKFQVDPTITVREDGSADTLALRPDDSQLKDIFKNMKEYLNVRDYDTPGEYDFMCGFGRTMCAINAYGDVYPCIQMPVPAGSLAEKSFREIWTESPLLKKIRDYKAAEIKKCAECGIFRFCNRCPGLAILEDGDLFGPSAESCRQARVVKEIIESETTPE